MHLHWNYQVRTNMGHGKTEELAQFSNDMKYREELTKPVKKRNRRLRGKARIKQRKWENKNA
jgi:thymidine kinase